MLTGLGVPNRVIAGTAWHRLEDNVWMPDLHQRAAVRWFFEAAFTNQFPDNLMEPVQLFCGSSGKCDMLGLLNFRSPSTVESLGLYSQTEDDSDDQSSEMDETDVEVEEEVQTAVETEEEFQPDDEIEEEVQDS